MTKLKVNLMAFLIIEISLNAYQFFFSLMNYKRNIKTSLVPGLCVVLFLAIPKRCGKAPTYQLHVASFHHQFSDTQVCAQG